jgi:hypothetical protein
MNLPSDTPRLPKWIFLAGYAALLVTSWFIWDGSAHPTTGAPLVAIVVCVALAAVLAAFPFVADYAQRQDEALDNRQRSLHALSVTVAAAAEQVSIAATGLQGIAEAAQDNFGKSEQLSKQIQEKIAELDGRLSTLKRDDGEAASRLEAAAKKIAKACAEFESAVARAADAARLVPAGPPSPREVPPVIASKIVEIRPAVLRPPVEVPPPPPAPAPAPEAESVPDIVADIVMAHESTPEPNSEPVAAPPEPPPAPAPRRRAPRKPPAPAPDLVLEAPADESPPAPSAPEISEPAVSSDGATRLVVTAYIGIGNRLFIRGEGPGLSWEKGVPLTFVSIGKWRWDTNDAAAPVRFKLYKNDEVECTALGERSVGPGAQQELSASF